MTFIEPMRAGRAADRQVGSLFLEPVSCVVAVPVCNERERIVACLDALARQVDVPGAGLGIILFLNNCTDGTRATVDAWVETSSQSIRIFEANSASATAGWARRRAMDAGARWLEEAGAHNGLLLTTDADSSVSPDWVYRNCTAIAAGADAVAGRVTFDVRDLAALPLASRRRHQLETNYDALLAEIEARLDPRRGDPSPRHRTKSGASIAVTLAAYRFVGGMPPLRSGEDHAFLDLVGTCGLTVRHAPDVVVTTSGRLDGRATGGTAETLKTWDDDPDRYCDARLERLSTFATRLLLGRMHKGMVAKCLSGRPLRPHELPLQIRRAQLLLSLIRKLSARRYGRRPSASDLSPETPKQLSLP